MKFLALTVLLASTSAFAAKNITGAEAIEEIGYKGWDSSIEGDNLKNERCEMNIVKDASGSMLVQIKTGSKTAFVTIHPTDKVVKTQKGDGGYGISTFKLPKGKISVTTFEDISDFDLVVNGTDCSWRE